MTIVSETPYEYKDPGDGTIVDFSFDFTVDSSSDVKVYVEDNDPESETYGVRELKSESTDYSVEIYSGTKKGMITFSAPIGVLEKVFLRRVTPLDQDFDYVEGDGFPADSHEDALDKLTRQQQEQASIIGATIRFPEFESGEYNVELPKKEIRAGKSFGFDEDGNISMVDFITQEVIDGIVAANAACVEAAATAEAAKDDAVEAKDIAVAAAASIDIPDPVAERVIVGEGATPAWTLKTYAELLSLLGITLGTSPTDVPTNADLGDGATADYADQATAEAGMDNEDLMTALRTYQLVTAMLNDVDVGNDLYNWDSQTFTTAESGDNYTVLATEIIVDLQAPGGGGGGRSGTGPSSGGGGGAGFFLRVRITGLTIGDLIPVTVGDEGDPGNSNGTDGTNGGTVSFGTYATCTGGKLGKGSISGVEGSNGYPGSGSIASSNVEILDACVFHEPRLGYGGGSKLGVGGVYSNTNPIGHGSGGGGANTYQSSGVAGQPGKITVYHPA